MNEIRVEAVVFGPGPPGYLKVLLGRGRGRPDAGVPTDVPVELIHASLRMPNSEFVAVVRGGEFVRVESDGPGWLEIQERIRAVLNAFWDPIGVADTVADEYDMYIGSIYTLLHRRASNSQIAEYLFSIESEAMGLPGTPVEQLLQVADRLRGLDLPTLNLQS